MNPATKGLGLPPGVVIPDEDCDSPKPQQLWRPGDTALRYISSPNLRFLLNT